MKNILSKINDFLQNKNHLFNFLAFCLAAVAIVYALKSNRDTNRQNLQIGEIVKYAINQNKHLREIVKKLPTRTIPSFPGNFPEIINNVINFTKGYNYSDSIKLFICTDVPAYAGLSQNNLWHFYNESILSFIDNGKIKVELITYNKDKIVDQTRNQFLKAFCSNNTYTFSDTGRIKFENAKKKWIENFYKHSSDTEFSTEKISSLNSYNDFEELVVNFPTRILSEFKKKASRSNFTFYEISSPYVNLSAFMWIVLIDGEPRRGVISFPSYGDEKSDKVDEKGIYTMDRELLKAFLPLYRGFRNSGELIKN